MKYAGGSKSFYDSMSRAWSKGHSPHPVWVLDSSSWTKSPCNRTEYMLSYLGLKGVTIWAIWVPRGSYRTPFFRIPSFMVRFCYLKK